MVVASSEARRKATARRARQTSPGAFGWATSSLHDSGGKPLHSIPGYAYLGRDYRGGAATSRIREFGFAAREECVCLAGIWQIALGEMFCAAAFALEFF
jgi:hypothetical protein